MGDEDGRVPIADFVAGLRQELKAAQAARAPQPQFTVVSGREGGPQGKVRFWVVEAGGSAKWSTAETQTVTLTLIPVDERGEDLHVADRVPGPPP